MPDIRGRASANKEERAAPRFRQCASTEDLAPSLEARISAGVGLIGCRNNARHREHQAPFLPPTKTPTALSKSITLPVRRPWSHRLQTQCQTWGTPSSLLVTTYTPYSSQHLQKIACQEALVSSAANTMPYMGSTDPPRPLHCRERAASAKTAAPSKPTPACQHLLSAPCTPQRDNQRHSVLHQDMIKCPVMIFSSLALWTHSLSFESSAAGEPILVSF